MRIALGIALSVLALVVGSNLWAVVRTPGHLQRLLADRVELERLLDFLASDRLFAEADTIKPVFGSYAANISTFDRIHLLTLQRTRNLLAGVAVGLVVAAYFVGVIVMLVVVVLILLPLSMDLPASAKNANATHLHTVLLNLRKWHTEAPSDCEVYCTKERPELAVARQIVLGSSGDI